MSVRRVGVVLLLAVFSRSAWFAASVAQEATAPPQFRAPPPAVASAEVAADRKVTFRLRAPAAEAVRLASSDIPNLPFGGGLAMTKGDDGVWSVEAGPLAPGAYRYVFDVDGVRVLDPENTAVSESNSNVWSLVVGPGSDLFDAKDVPHGAVAEVTYASQTLKHRRRMHVYTPPGYEAGDQSYPVLYLLHGAMDSDASWSTVGQAGSILDNLIAAGKAAPMIVVMPNGHTGPFSFGAPNALDRQIEEFVADFTQDVRPYIESHYRVRKDRAGRAIAGLSMGGAQTLEIAVGGLQDYAYVGVFSSGVFGGNPAGPPQPGPSWEERHKAALDDAALKDGLQLVWFATGKDDFLIGISRATVATLRAHGFTVDFQESEGGHTWLNWRDYLGEFAPLLFREVVVAK